MGTSTDIDESARDLPLSMVEGSEQRDWGRDRRSSLFPFVHFSLFSSLSSFVGEIVGPFSLNLHNDHVFSFFLVLFL